MMNYLNQTVSTMY